jgi:molybdenum cofactor cytidylyltransferase
VEAARVGAVVLAAGLSSRFGATKVLAPLGGRPVLQHILDAVAAAGVGEIVVVLGTRADEVEAAIRWRGERRVRNPDPAAGLSTSLRVGIGALSPAVDAALIVLGDQPLVRPVTIASLIRALESGQRAAAVPRYDAGGGPNPVLLGRAAWPLAFETTGDRGLGPLLRDHPDVVREVPVAGTNPDVDTPGDLAALAWGERVRANREQVDRVREVPDGADFYAPLTQRFLADPRRTDDAILDQLLRLARPGDTWLDIGAGAGRFALPIALRVREVIALDASAGMLAALREQSASGGIANVRTVEARWPPDAGTEAGGVVADVTLIASVGHDIEGIGAFLDAMEAASRRLCVAVMSERQPSAVAEPFWPPVHGEARVTLPSLPDLLELLDARGRRVDLTVVEQPPRGYPDEETLVDFVRGQLWIAPGGPKDRRLRELVRADLVERDGRVGLRGEAVRRIGVVRWEPR